MSGTATLSLGRVVFLDDGTWRADPSGAPAMLIPVHDRFGGWVDILAYHLDAPCEWRLRFGDECPILGAADLAQAAWYQEPVSLYSTPERWLRARCHTRGGDRLHHQGGDHRHHHHHHQGGDAHHAICILHWGVAVGPLFEGVSRVECDCPELRTRFRKSLRAWEPKTTSPSTTREARHAA